MARTELVSLHRLAGLYGVQIAYRDNAGRRRQASPDALVAILGALGAPLTTLREVNEALGARTDEVHHAGVEPVIVSWGGRRPSIRIPAAPGRETHAVHCRLQLEDGQSAEWIAQPGRFLLPRRLPLGYHRLVCETADHIFETLIISAPRRAYELSPDASRPWGVFLPLYALHSARSWGGGDLADLAALMDWIGGLGGGVVATLPLLAAFLDQPFGPSPYSPASRLFWNELYVDIVGSPDLARSPEARSALASSDVAAAVPALREAPEVEYRKEMALKRRVLEPMARVFFAEPDGRLEAFRRWAATVGPLEDYARFRAVCDRRRAPWQTWPQAQRDGLISDGDFDESDRRYHLYVQWLAHEQLATLSQKARAHGPGLYLDLPLGVNPDGFDVWRERTAFAPAIAVGAPPDTLNTRGQNWGFPPLHPRRIREEGYRHYLAVIRHHLQHAGILRIDHVMGLHRFFWIPDGMDSRDGVYVRYPAHEFHAMLTLESHRHQALVVGEDLGTVPGYIRNQMQRHNIRGMYVVQYEASPSAARPLPPIPPGALASLNTHDMPPFAAFWEALDVEDRLSLGLLDAPGERFELSRRALIRRLLQQFLAERGYLVAAEAPASVSLERTDGSSGSAATPTPDDDAAGTEAAAMRALLAWLAESPAGIVIVNLEDLWLEPRPQNTPGTADERPNWRRKARYPLEAFTQMEEVKRLLLEVDRRRRSPPRAADSQSV